MNCKFSPAKPSEGSLNAPIGKLQVLAILENGSFIELKKLAECIHGFYPDLLAELKSKFHKTKSHFYRVVQKIVF